MGQVIFYLPVAVFIYTLYMVLEERNNRTGKAFNLNALVMVISFIVISFLWGFSIGKLLAVFGIGISIIFIALSYKHYRIGFFLCAIISAYVVYRI